ncbi:MAG: hypothetical protein AB7O65_14710, partial [Candidatus Korobacteraceae bacterium]
MNFFRKRIVFPLLGALMLVAAVQAQQSGITRHELPAEVTYPEGIAYDAKAGAVYTGSADKGNLVRMTLENQKTVTISPAGSVLPGEPFPAVLGMKVDGSGRLWVSGGRTGQMAVVDSRSGKLLKRFQTPAEPAGLINDVAIAGGNAYFTDTLRPTLWR